MARRKVTVQKTIADMMPLPFVGGCKTYLPATSLPSGAFSMIQNMRATHPGFESRLGTLKLYATAHSATKTLSLYHFSKGKRVEKHLLVQYSDGDVYEATNHPPAVSTGAFGTLKYSGDATSYPAAYSVIDDTLLYSDGIDQHQLFPGDANPIKNFTVYSSAVTLPKIPELGSDYTMEVLDATTTTYAIISALGTNAADTILICCPAVPSKLNITMTTSINAVVSALTVKYMKSGSPDAFTTVGASLSDGTATGGATFAKSGTISWDTLTDMVPSFMFGMSGFWLSLTVSVALSATVRINQVTYGGAFQPLQNVWDGDGITALEARFYIATSAAYFTYYGASIDISAMVATNDALYFNTIDLMNAFYVDSTSTPSTTASVTPHLYYWTGSAWTEVSNLVDNTAGFTTPGWITFTKAAAQKTMFQTSYYSYWWKLTVTGGNLSTDVRIGIYTMPYYDINEIATAGRCNCSWKNRAVYGTDRDQYLLVSALHQPMVLNGSDFGILDPGDGRSNLPVCMRQFKNELMVWQEEKGTEGGCFTLFEGYNPDTYGKLVLSNKLGALNANSAVVIEGVEVSTETGVEVRTVVYVLSHYGVYMSDGRFCTMISDDIRNRFDPTSADCITRGRESDMWLAYDSTYNVLKLGLVCGTGGTVPNVFPVYDLTDSAWMFDVGQGLSSMCEVEAGSGDVTVLQCGGGSADGLIHLLNTGTTDNGTEIVPYAQMELDGGGLIMNLREMILSKTGNVTITPYQDGVAQTAKVI
uniref:Uncharacterized protein n=1 Tax=viral metagenome TaxID=1070528 RepID=A0A6M3J6A4_9ZZZZ